MPLDHLRVASGWATLLDNKFSIGKFGFGIDPVINAIPILGPIITFGLSAYILWIAYSYGAPADMKGTMLRNIILDALMGAIPVVGTIGDLFFKANIRNLTMLQEWIASRPMEGEVVSSRRVSMST